MGMVITLTYATRHLDINDLKILKSLYASRENGITEDQKSNRRCLMSNSIFFVAYTNDQEEHFFAECHSLAEAREEAQGLLQTHMQQVDILDEYDTHYALEAVV